MNRLRYLNEAFFCCVLLLSNEAAFAQPMDLIWDRSGAQDSSLYGSSVLPLGDQNHDGYSDWAVWAEGNRHIFQDPGSVYGLVEFFHGGNPPDTVPYMTITGDLAPWGAAGAVGDLNGDGDVDWFTKRFNDTQDAYIVALYFGGLQADTIGDLSFEIEGPDEILPIGDFNGDGYDDLYWYHDGMANFGQTLYGGNPMDTIPDWTVHNQPGWGWQPIPGAHGDLNNDGYADWVSIPSVNNTVYIFPGSAVPDTVPVYSWQSYPGPQEVIGDMNNDDYDDLLFRDGEIHFGGQVLHSEPDAILNFPCNWSHVAASGDFNHDGYGDVVLVNENCNSAPEGVLSMYLGHPWINPQPVFSIYGWEPPLNLYTVWTAAGLGDVNGDGIDDLAIGALDDLDYAGWRGRCVVLAGDSSLRVEANSPRPEIPQRLDVSVYPNPFNSQSRITFTIPRASDASLELINLIGQRVASIACGHYSPGEHSVTLNVDGLSSGIYFVRLEAGDLRATQKVVLIK